MYVQNWDREAHRQMSPDSLSRYAAAAATLLPRPPHQRNEEGNLADTGITRS